MQRVIKRDFRGGKDAPTTVANSVVLSPGSFSHALSQRGSSRGPPSPRYRSSERCTRGFVCPPPTNPDETDTFPFYEKMEEQALFEHVLIPRKASE